MKKKGLTKFLLGALVGTGLGALLSPKTGEENRADLKKKIDELAEKVKEIDSKEVKKEVEAKIKKISKELEDLDKEKVKEIAIEKAEKLKESATELVDYAIEKGTPALEKLASSIKEKALTTAKNVIEKIEQEEK